MLTPRQLYKAAALKPKTRTASGGLDKAVASPAVAAQAVAVMASHAVASQAVASQAVGVMASQAVAVMAPLRCEVHKIHIIAFDRSVIPVRSVLHLVLWNPRV